MDGLVLDIEDEEEENGVEKKRKDQEEQRTGQEDGVRVLVLPLDAEENPSMDISIGPDYCLKRESFLNKRHCKNEVYGAGDATVFSEIEIPGISLL